jgi:hypothetical protein
MNNTIYVAANSLDQVQVWPDGSTNLMRIISGNLSGPCSVFSTMNGDIYVDNGNNGQVDKWILNANNSVPVMNVSNSCSGLFIDTNNTLYCSIYSTSQVVKMSLSGSVPGPTTIAATGLYHPHGIFVDSYFNLYVADSDNAAVQKFQAGQVTGTKLVTANTTGIGSPWCPTDVVLDADGYLFISDYCGNRIVAEGPDGFRCVVGCGRYGSGPDQVKGPQGISFDSYGNLFLVDFTNNRIQKYFLETNFCGNYECCIIIEKPEYLTCSWSYFSEIHRCYTLHFQNPIFVIFSYNYILNKS